MGDILDAANPVKALNPKNAFNNVKDYYTNVYTLGLFGNGSEAPPGSEGLNAQFKPGMGSEGIEVPKDPTLNNFDFGKQYAAKDTAKNLPEFRALRDQVISQKGQGYNDANDAIVRKFASSGNLNSGAALKGLTGAYAQVADQGASASNQLNAEESSIVRALANKEAQREFQSQENFNQKQFGASGQARQEQMALNQGQFENANKLKQLDLAVFQAEQAGRESQFNSETAKYGAKHSGGLLGQGGFLGTGMGLG